MQSSLLFRHPKTHLYWWTAVPALPENRGDPKYDALKRVWADHTMNCLSQMEGNWKLASSRGFYVETREDHITPVLFHIWAAYPDVSWVGHLLDVLRMPHGLITRANWSFSWEQKREPSRRPDITDIVLSWEDEQGQAVVVIEAKRPGGKLTAKDITGGEAYLQLPSIRPFNRKIVAFLVDAADVNSFSATLPRATPIISWQNLGLLQMDHVYRLSLPIQTQQLISSYIAKHYSDLGIPLGQPNELERRTSFGSEAGYAALRALTLTGTLERFLLGSEATFCARTGRMPAPPLEWLSSEPSFIDVVTAKSQTTADREKLLWRLRSSKDTGQTA